MLIAAAVNTGSLAVSKLRSAQVRDAGEFEGGKVNLGSGLLGPTVRDEAAASRVTCPAIRDWRAPPRRPHLQQLRPAHPPQ